MSFLPEPMSSTELSVSVSHLLVATPERCDPLLDPAVPDTLALLREMLKVDAVFVAEIVERPRASPGMSQRVTRAANADPSMGVNVGDTVPLQDTYCHLVLEGRAPTWIPDVHALAERLGDAPPPYRGHISIPIQLASGRIYGTLCSLSRQALSADGAQGLAVLRRAAAMIAARLAEAGVA